MRKKKIVLETKMSRGDLGFIANVQGRMPNRNFFGSPGHPSKKGVIGISQVSKLNPEDVANPQVSLRTEFTPEAIISKRTEWLESQERKMTATIHETRSDTNHLQSKLEGMHDEINNIYQTQKNACASLYEEMQSLFGRPSTRNIPILTHSVTVDEYARVGGETTLVHLTETEWLSLVYPMKHIKLSENKTQSLMRWKRIDKDTGQLSLDWVVVYERDEQVETRYISEFSLYPR